MDLVVTPDIYVPTIDANGNYTDIIPVFKYELSCPCGSKPFATRSKFTSHTKCQRHVKWLATLNQNRENHLVDSIKYKKVCASQQQIISEQDKRISQQACIIEYFSNQVISLSSPPTIDLLD